MLDAANMQIGLATHECILCSSDYSIIPINHDSVTDISIKSCAWLRAEYQYSSNCVDVILAPLIHSSSFYECNKPVG